MVALNSLLRKQTIERRSNDDNLPVHGFNNDSNWIIGSCFQNGYANCGI